MEDRSAGKIRVLIVDDNVAPLTLNVIRCLGTEDNLEIHLLNLNNLWWPSYRFSRYVKSYTSKLATDNQTTYAFIRDACLQVNADIVIPVKEKTVGIVSEYSSDLRKIVHLPPLPDPITLELVRNKWLLYNWLFEINLAHDTPLRYTDVVKSPLNSLSFNYPFLIKPFWGSGGRGIVLIKNSEELNHFKPCKEFNQNELMIQNFINGRDIDISVLAIEGKILAYAIQQDISGNKKLEYSKSIEFVHDHAVLKFAATIFSELKYSGIAHLDFRVDDKEQTLKLIDFNARYWSSMLGALTAGINFPWLSCQCALNESITIPEFREGRYYVTNNLFKVLTRRIPLTQTEIFYTLADPLPFFIEFKSKIAYHLKKLLRRKR